MSIRLEFINLIIPRKIIEKKYTGGWKQCLLDRQVSIDCGSNWYDDHLFRTGAMNAMDIECMLTDLEGMGFKPYKGRGKDLKWNDVCVVDTSSGKPTLQCDWIEIRDGKASLKGTQSKHKKRIRGTAVVIRENKVLLVKDRGKKKFSLPGGGTNRNEPSLSAAIRELYEELDMSARKAERIFKCDFLGSFNKHKVSLIETDDEPFLKSRELEEFCWWNMKDQIPRYAHVDYIIKQLGIF